MSCLCAHVRVKSHSEGKKRRRKKFFAIKYAQLGGILIYHFFFLSFPSIALLVVSNQSWVRDPNEEPKKNLYDGQVVVNMRCFLGYSSRQGKRVCDLAKASGDLRIASGS